MVRAIASTVPWTSMRYCFNQHHDSALGEVQEDCGGPCSAGCPVSRLGRRLLKCFPPTQHVSLALPGPAPAEKFPDPPDYPSFLVIGGDSGQHGSPLAKPLGVKCIFRSDCANAVHPKTETCDEITNPSGGQVFRPMCPTGFVALSDTYLRYLFSPLQRCNSHIW